jgi:hypothetical protein
VLDEILEERVVSSRNRRNLRGVIDIQNTIRILK